jgi:hypothetical protein
MVALIAMAVASKAKLGKMQEHSQESVEYPRNPMLHGKFKDQKSDRHYLFTLAPHNQVGDRKQEVAGTSRVGIRGTRNHNGTSVQDGRIESIESMGSRSQWIVPRTLGEVTGEEAGNHLGKGRRT